MGLPSILEWDDRQQSCNWIIRNLNCSPIECNHPKRHNNYCRAFSCPMNNVNKAITVPHYCKKWPSWEKWLSFRGECSSVMRVDPEKRLCGVLNDATLCEPYKCPKQYEDSKYCEGNCDSVW